MTYARRTDANQSDIVATLRTLGCVVYVTSSIGNGFPDLIVTKAGQRRFVEVKDGDKSPGKRRLTDKEVIYAKILGEQYAVIETQEQAHQLVADMQLAGALNK